VSVWHSQEINLSYPLRILSNVSDVHLQFPFLLGSAPELVSSEDKPAATESGSSVEPDEKDIKLVMDQANVEREKAVKAIKEADGDLINASEFCGINC